MVIILDVSIAHEGTLLVHISTNNQISHVSRVQKLSGNNLADNEAVERSRGPSESQHAEAGAERMPKLTLQLISQI